MKKMRAGSDSCGGRQHDGVVALPADGSRSSKLHRSLDELLVWQVRPELGPSAGLQSHPHGMTKVFDGGGGALDDVRRAISRPIEADVIRPDREPDRLTQPGIAGHEVALAAG